MNWTLLIRYLSNQCTPEETQRVRQWLKEDERNKDFLDFIGKIWEVEPRDEFEFDAKKAWNHFKVGNLRKDAVRIPGSSPDGDKSRRIKKPWGAYFSAAAAVFIIVFLFFYSNNGFGLMGEADRGQFTMQEIITEKGQKTTFTLSDGTRVILNSGSTLRIPGRFKNESREVYLEGEAYFEVVHRENDPFIVHSGSFYTRVMGTEFVVSSYPDDENPEVAVSEGKVSLNKEDDSGHRIAYVEKEQLGRLEKNGNFEVTAAGDLGQYLGWTTGKLVFSETPLSEIASKLERWYDIEVQVQDSSVLSRKLTAEFDKEPLTEVLRVITISLELEYDYRRDKRTISFFNNRNPAQEQ